jgi:hypothetical protein
MDPSLALEMAGQSQATSHLVQSMQTHQQRQAQGLVLHQVPAGQQ